MSADEQYIYEVKLRRDDVPSFDKYPVSLDAVKNFSTIKLHPKVTFFIGENGSGKSTLMEAIAVSWGFNPEGGTKALILEPANHIQIYMNIYASLVEQSVLKMVSF